MNDLKGMPADLAEFADTDLRKLWLNDQNEVLADLDDDHNDPHAGLDEDLGVTPEIKKATLIRFGSAEQQAASYTPQAIKTAANAAMPGSFPAAGQTNASGNSTLANFGPFGGRGNGLMADLFSGKGGLVELDFHQGAAMQGSEAAKLRQQWGGEPCTHPVVDREYYLSAHTGEYVCVTCGEDFKSREEAREDGRKQAERIKAMQK